jgi:Nif-specific regulatory protein
MNPRLVITAGPLRGKVVPVEESEFSIGRDPANRLPIGDSSISRRHCLIRAEGENHVIQDLDSRNGTFVNEVPVRNRVLTNGDQVRIGHSMMLFLIPGMEGEEQKPPVEPPEEALLTRTVIQLSADEAIYLRAGAALEASPAGRAGRDLAALFRIAMAVCSTRDLGSLQRRLLEEVLQALPADRGAVLLRDERGEGLASEFVLPRGPARTQAPVSRTIVRQVIETGKAVLANDILKDERYGGEGSIRSSGSRSLIAAPLVLFGDVRGVLYADTSDPGVCFDEGHLQLLVGIAGAAALSLENALRLRRLEEEKQQLLQEVRVEHNMVGESAKMRDVYQFVGRVAATDTTVLIRGESGTGKELVARAIHLNSPRAGRPFVALNCAALAETLLESELFGHEKGAFTGAIAQKRGKLEAADGGTLFLDEVGDVPLSVQVKLLRVLQEREFERVGGTRPIEVDIRLIAATNRDLEAAMKEGRFRPDLYFRLNVVSVTLPPLRERPEDIPLLASYFVSKCGAKVSRRVSGISWEARSWLMRYPWPGNVRELENAIEHAVVLGSNDIILPEDLPEAVLETVRPASGGSASYHGRLQEMKKRLIQDALVQAGGNVTEAARMLDLHPNYLHRLLTNLGLRERGI